jgi:hypothetical protein
MAMKNPARTNTGRWRGQFHADEAAVLYYTGFTLVELTDLKLDLAKRWLTLYAADYFGMGESNVGDLWQSPELLRWWNLHWRRHDHYYVLPVLHRLCVEERAAVYRELHEEVFDRQYPTCGAMLVSLMRLMVNGGEFNSPVLKKF